MSNNVIRVLQLFVDWQRQTGKHQKNCTECVRVTFKLLSKNGTVILKIFDCFLK